MRGNMDFWEIYEAFFSRIHAYVRCRAASDAEAEDITSSVFQKALAKQDQFDPLKGNIPQWLFGIARNEVNYHFRVQALRRFLPLDLFENSLPSHDDPVSDADREAENNWLMKALEKLDSRERDLVSLKFFSELNNREIAGLTGISESNVGTILYRCMARLRKEMTENYHGNR